MSNNIPSLPDVSQFRMPKLSEIKSPPEYAFEALISQMQRFQAGLSSEMELGIIANGAGLLIHVEKVHFAGQMMVFSGVDSNGHQSQLIQHFTQTNVQMIAVPKLQEKPRRVGF